jgi:cold shock CspA family protein
MKHVREHLLPFRPKDLRGPLASAPAPVVSNQNGQDGRNVGRITLYDEYRGFGFIKPNYGGEDVFFGRSEANRAGQLSVGNRVEYRVSLGGNGRLSAVDLVKLQGRIEQ